MTAPGAERTTPQAEDVAAAMADVERAMAILDRAMPSCKFKISILHRLTLFVADWRFKAGYRTCGDCGAGWSLSTGEAAWFEARGWAVPTRCRPCRAQKRAERAAQDAD